MKPIVRIPASVLSEPTKRVEVFDKKLALLVKEMSSTLTATTNPKGVGLAAPQVGVGLQIFVMKPTDKSPVTAYINPEIIEKSETITDNIKESDKRLEGCLSIPNIWGKVIRDSKILLSFQDINGVHLQKKFSGFPAVIVQHETDHLNGILFTRRVLEQKNKLYQTAIDETGKEILEEIKI
jgi:peptide deformylase